MVKYESLWARGWSDTIRAVKSFPGLLVEIGGTAVIGLWTQDAWATIYFLAGCFLCVLIVATATAPIRQRNEARLDVGAARTGEKKQSERALELEKNLKDLERHLSIAGLGTHKTIQAVISCSLNGTVRILDSSGVSSVIDHGVGDFEIRLLEKIKPDQSRIVPLSSTPPYTVVSVSKDCFRIKFHSADTPEPRKFGFTFEAPQAVD